jgi:uncharacterized protein YcbX
MEQIRIGDDVVLRGVRPCERCKVPCVDQSTGSFEQKIWEVMERHFCGANNIPLLGENFIVEKGGVITNENVEILKRRDQGHDRPYTPLSKNKRS